ncbi:FAD-binding oxidoreductase [Aestuariibacter salexigens]|uniref:FAD-binding oxidoreductase n=1 Tax=Aestuariibacter salexigens TaxID=226010 RepID=UPI00042A7D2E|nr:FAD-binding oxidoreductase [Aestuariibacter salexigens]
MKLQDYDIGERYQATVINNHAITPANAADELRELTLEVDKRGFTIDIGQSIGVIVPGVPEIGHDHHFRLYSIASQPVCNDSGNTVVTICVKRCSYIDEYSGESYKGIASHYLCDRETGDQLQINGPFGTPFPVPQDKQADLLLVGMGTGIAPFRAFVQHIYRDVRDWQGRVRLFYGAHTGLELAYMNDHQNDFAQYYDEQTFEAIQALSDRGYWSERGAVHSIQTAIQDRAEEILDMLSQPHAYIYVAGLKQIEEGLNQAFSDVLGSEQQWQKRKEELEITQRWIELLY